MIKNKKALGFLLIFSLMASGYLIESALGVGTPGWLQRIWDRISQITIEMGILQNQNEVLAQRIAELEASGGSDVPDTMFWELTMQSPSDPTFVNIEVDLEGYKTVQISYGVYTSDSWFLVQWLSDSGMPIGPSVVAGHDLFESDAISTPVMSNTLNIYVDRNIDSELVSVMIYATK